MSGQTVPRTRKGLANDGGRTFGGFFEVKPFRGLMNTTVGPLYLGLWGLASIGFFAICVAIILAQYLAHVNYSPTEFLFKFAILSVDPPVADNGLAIAPWEQGGAWQAATFFLTMSILFWNIRLIARAQDNGLRPAVAWTFLAAVFFYLVIYLIRPMVMGTWAEAPPHGLKTHIDWANNVSVRYGNFYYNPFHMLSIFFLLGSTMLYGMHGATILAAARDGAHEEEAEIIEPSTGTHKSQLFWRWTMGFNANAYSIHVWALVFGVLCVLTGAIGLFLSGVVVNDWFAWGIEAGIVNAPNPPNAPPPPTILP
jgi:photosynthetic reaction center M subunit